MWASTFGSLEAAIGKCTLLRHFRSYFLTTMRVWIGFCGSDRSSNNLCKCISPRHWSETWTPMWEANIHSETSGEEGRIHHFRAIIYSSIHQHQNFLRHIIRMISGVTKIFLKRYFWKSIFWRGCTFERLSTSLWQLSWGHLQQFIQKIVD